MRIKILLTITTLLIGTIIALTACETSTSTNLEESFQNLKKVTPITGIQIETLEVNNNANQEGYLTVRLNNGIEKEAWCIEWDEQEAFGIQNGAKLYSTKGHKEWEKVNYLMRIKDELKADDPELTPRDIQVVIWSLIDNPPFNVDKISEYENIDPRIFKDGQPLFNIQKVKNIVHLVNTHLSSNKFKIAEEISGVTVIENDGQTLITGDETAFAVKTNPTTGGQNVVDSDYSTCFSQEIIENVSFNRWGWTNGPLSEAGGELVFDLYAGAGQCNLNNKGARVGELTVHYSNGTITATYKMTETSEITGTSYTLTETHLYVGNDPYPKNQGSGKFTVAPGKYGSQNNHDNITEYTYEIDDLSGDVYFIAHAVVNGFEPKAD